MKSYNIIFLIQVTTAIVSEIVRRNLEILLYLYKEYKESRGTKEEA